MEEKSLEKIVQEFNKLNRNRYSCNHIWPFTIWAVVYFLVLAAVGGLYCKVEKLQWQDILLATVIICSVTILVYMVMVNIRKSMERESKYNESMQRNIVNAYGKLLDHAAEMLTKKETEDTSGKASKDNTVGTQKSANS